MIRLLAHSIYLVVYILVFILSHLLYIFLPKKIKAWIKLKTKFTATQLPVDANKKTYWFHAASGEIEYVKSTIRELRAKEKKAVRIVVTYSSPSAPLLFTNIQDEVDVFIPLCWDLDIFNNRLIKLINPSVVIFARTDFWPRLIYNLKRKNIPIVAISLFPKTNHLSRFWLKYVLSPMRLITCVNPSSQTYLKNILPQHQIEFIPDTRFDQVLHRLSNPSKIEIKNHAQFNFFVIGSSWPADEDVIIPAVQNILQLGYKIIWAPHETQHAPELIAKLKAQSSTLQLSLLSNLMTTPSAIDIDSSDILIVDRIGFLADFYRFSSLAFVGGSFVSKVHSVMEPLCAGNPVIVGPYYSNNPEAIHFEQLKTVLSVHNTQEFLNAVHYIHSHQNELKSKIQNEILKFTGGTKIILNSLENVMS